MQSQNQRLTMKMNIYQDPLILIVWQNFSWTQFLTMDLYQ